MGEVIAAASDRAQQEHDARMIEWAHALLWLVNAGTMGRDKKSGTVTLAQLLPEHLRPEEAKTSTKPPTQAQLKRAEIRRHQELLLLAEETPALVADEQSQARIAEAKARLVELGKPWIPTADRGRRTRPTPSATPPALDTLLTRATATPTQIERD